MISENRILHQMNEEGVLIPRISQLNLTDFKPGHQYFEHGYQGQIEIILSLQGSCYIIIGEQCLKLRKNEVLIIFPGVVHNFYLKKKESTRIYDLILNVGQLPDFQKYPTLGKELSFLKMIQTGSIQYFRAFDDCRLQKTIEEMHYHYTQSSKESSVFIKLAACELYLKLSKILNETDIMTECVNDKVSYVNAAKKYISTFYTTKLLLEDVAKASGITSRHLSRLFNKEYGMTVQEYINVLKVNRAKELLENTDIDITEIAYSLGFNTSDYFSTFFKRFENISPRMFRKRRKLNRAY